MTSTTTDAFSIPGLRAAIDGRVITPDDAEYDQARTVVLGGIDRRPLVIVRPANADDVAKVVTLARETGLPLAVRCGGHSAAGHSVVDDGIVIDLRDMKALEIDVEGRTAWAEAGLTAGEYTTAAAAHDLATGFGDTGFRRDRRDHARRRCRLSRPQARPDDRLAAGGRHRDRRRPAPSRRCRASSGPVLGDPRWRRQLRRRDPLPIPAASARVHRGRHADPAGHRRDDRRVHRRGRGRARRAVDDREHHALPADAVRARGAPREARQHGAHDLRRR